MKIVLQSKTEETLSFKDDRVSGRVPPQYALRGGHVYQFAYREGDDAVVYRRVSFPEVLDLSAAEPEA